MIDWDSGLKPWHLVADAGFGAAMEECGFRKVGRSMWRRDGDRIAWCVALTRGYAGTPGSFRASYGGFVKEVDELVRLFNPKRRMECMPGTSTPWHVGRCLEDDLFNEYENEVLAARASEQARRKGLRGWWKDQIDPVSDSRIEIWNAQIPFYENTGPGSLDWAFVVGSERDVATASGLVADAWVRLGLPWVQARIDFEQPIRGGGDETHSTSREAITGRSRIMRQRRSLEIRRGFAIWLNPSFGRHVLHWKQYGSIVGQTVTLKCGWSERERWRRRGLCLPNMLVVSDAPQL